MGAELGNFARRFLADVNRDADGADEGAHKNGRDQPGRNVANAQCTIETAYAVHGVLGVQENLRHPRQQDENENENVIAFQSAADCFQLADLEAGQDQIFAYEFFPFALKQLAIFHHHRNKKMRFEHPDTRAECVVKTVTTRLDPEEHPNNGQIEKEDDVRHFASRKCDGNNGRGTGNGPVRGYIQPLPPNHDPSHFAAIKMRHRVDVARIVNAALEGDCSLLIFS